jgi:hypothetical protein
VGPLRQTFAAAVDLSPEEHTAIVHGVADMALNGEVSPFTILSMSGPDGWLAKLQDGRGLQPAEIKAVRETLGDELANVVAERPQLPSASAKLSEEALATIEQRRQMGQAGIARAEEIGKAQHALADDLKAQAFETNDPRLHRLADQARARGIAAQNRADELEIKQNRAYLERVSAKQEPSMTLGEDGKFHFNQAGREHRDAYLADQAKAEARDELPKVAESGKSYEQTLLDRNPNNETLLTHAQDWLGQHFPQQSSLNKEAVESIRLWTLQNETLVDAVGPSSHELLASVRGSITGGANDSLATSLLNRKAILESALKATGVEPEVAGRIGKTLMVREIINKFGGAAAVPPRLIQVLEETQRPAGKLATGAAEWSSKAKALAFGPPTLASSVSSS